jgi:hypothetical protein
VTGAVVLQGAPGTAGATLAAVVSDNGTTNPTHSTLAAAVLNLVMDATNRLNLVLVAGAASLPQGQPYTATLATAAGGIQLGGLTQSAGTLLDSSTYTVTAQGMLIGPTYQLAVDGTGQALTFTFTPVPEPVTVLGLAAAGLGLAALVRRRRSRVPA